MERVARSREERKVLVMANPGKHIEEIVVEPEEIPVPQPLQEPVEQPETVPADFGR